MARYFLFLLLFIFSSSLIQAEESKPVTPGSPTASGDSTPTDSGAPEYIQYEEFEDGSSSLQTALTRFEKDGVLVDLVSVVHLADEAYYDTIDAVLSHYDRVLYEMVGGAFQKQAPISPEASPEASGIRQIQQMASSILGLKFQLDSIDYEAANFVHADVDWGHYEELMSAKNQSFSTLFTRAMRLSQEGDLPGMPKTEEASQLMMQRLMGAVMTGNSNELKCLLAPFLAESEALIAKLEGDDGTVLVTERNKVVMKKLNQLIEQGIDNHFAIFYGGGHMPDLEVRLIDLGFEKTQTSWMNAWAIEEESVVADSDSAPVNPLGEIMRVLSENPELMKSLQELGSQLQESPAEEESATKPLEEDAD